MPNKNIFYSILIFLIVSLGIGVSLNLLGLPFLPSFIFAIFVQYFVGDIIVRVFAARDLRATREAEQKIVETMSQQYVNVKCPCDKKTEQLVMLNLNEENLYKCNDCQKDLKAMVGWKSFQTTTPLTEDPFKNFNFTENRDYEV